MDYGLYNRNLLLHFIAIPLRHSFFFFSIGEGRGKSRFHMGDVKSGIFIVNVCIEHWGSVPISNHTPWTRRSIRLIELASVTLQ